MKLQIYYSNLKMKVILRNYSEIRAFCHAVQLSHITRPCQNLLSG